jgi:hypothetical protein
MTLQATNFLPVGFVLPVLLMGLAAAVLWIWSLVDALCIPDRQWTGAGQSKVLWVLVIVLVGLLGSLLYLVIARPALSRARLA